MDPIHDTMQRWNQHLKGELVGGFDAILHQDCVFWSPVLFKPQIGRDLTAMYLSAAGMVLPGDTADQNETASPTTGTNGSFRYTKRVLDGHTAVLEFETTIDDVHVNGVDIITCDDNSMITEFKVMMRPHRALDAVRQQMAATLEKMSTASPNEP